MPSLLYPNISERSLLFLVGAVQFVNILDFMMVLPLGPDLAQSLDIPMSHLGWIGGSYTAASAVSGIICSFFIDKLDRKTALLMAVAGLTVATLLGGLAWNSESLIVTRVLAGICGGPATSLAWSIVADIIEPARRGSAMGKVMGAFSLAAIIGVPFSLEMAALGSWRRPFFTTGLLCALVLLFALIRMPSMRAHIRPSSSRAHLPVLLGVLRKRQYMLTYLYVSVAMLASFMIIPNIPAYVQYNLHYPRPYLGMLYAAGGVASLITMRITGKLIDRYNASITSLISTFTYMGVLWIGFISPPEGISVLTIFILFMFAMGMRNVSSTTLATKIPTPEERAGFMSLFSCVQGAAMSAGAFFSAHVITSNPDNSLNGIAMLATIAASISLLVPLLMRRVELLMKNPQ